MKVASKIPIISKMKGMSNRIFFGKDLIPDAGPSGNQVSVDGVTIEIPKQPAGLTIDDIMYIKDIENREIQMVAGEIDDVFADSFERIIRHYNKEDGGKVVSSRKPILLFIDSPGGSVTAGMTIIDSMKLSKTPIYTVVIGTAYSMALHVAAHGKKRFAFPKSTFLLHDGSEGCFDSSSKVKDRVKFTEALGEKLKDDLISVTNISAKDYEINERREWYMFADEAMKLGLIDYIMESYDDLSLDNSSITTSRSTSRPYDYDCDLVADTIREVMDNGSDDE